MIDEENQRHVPIWFSVDLKEKFPYKKHFPNTVIKLLDIRLYECPHTWITNYTKQLINMLIFQENPIKIVDAPWTMQPKWWVEAINIYKKVKVDLLELKKAKKNG